MQKGRRKSYKALYLDAKEDRDYWFKQFKAMEKKCEELEKLGFKKHNCYGCDGYIYEYDIYKNNGLYITIEIMPDRTITLDVNCDEDWTDKLDIFYELFANDMVEKDGE